MDRRRPSYASVVGGSAASSGPGQAPPVRSGAFAHLMNPASSNTPLSYSYGPDMENRASNTQNHSHSSDNIQGNALPNQPSSWARGGVGVAPNYWSAIAQASYAGDWGTSSTLFIRPSYLRGTRYLERLEAAHRAKPTVQPEPSPHVHHNPNSGSLSASSSSVSLQRMAPSHRGMTYEIVENSPPVEEDTVPPLPSHWKEHDRAGGLEVSADGVDLRCSSVMKSQEHEAVAARTDCPAPPECGIYYYEVSILSRGKEGMVGIGFSNSKASLEKLPGWEPDSWAYHGDDGKSYCCQMTGRPYGSKFAVDDVVGCGINFRTGTAFFTKNGVAQGIAFKDLKDIKLYPSVGMKKQGTHVKVNFGQNPFMFDIDAVMKAEREKVREEIESADVSTIQPPLDESALIKGLVSQFLRHDGYIETARAFADELRIEANALRKESDSIANSFEIHQDVDAVNRQQIRAAILDGDIEKALKRTNAYYPYVLRDNPDIYFRLRCRKFVEMMRLCTEPVSQPSRGKAAAAAAAASNGHAEEVFEQDMELDDLPPPYVSYDWDTMDTEETETRGAGFQDRMNETLEYGKNLQKQYKDDRTKDQALKEIFALFAYEDPGNSPTARVMDPSGRLPVAEELNSAILVSLGKSSTAAIERLCQQTDILLAEISDQRGAGAFINVRELLR